MKSHKKSKLPSPDVTAAASPLASEVVDRMKSALALKNDSELARTLGVNPSTVAMWRKRGSVPYEQATKVAAETASSISYLLSGIAPQHAGTPLATAANEKIVAAIFLQFERSGWIELKPTVRREHGDLAADRATDFLVYFSNALAMFGEMTDKHGMTAKEAVELVARSIYPPRA
ncbi:MAG: helix-turn-helix domain-containing protein [Bauldia sp.]